MADEILSAVSDLSISPTGTSTAIIDSIKVTETLREFAPPAAISTILADALAVMLIACAVLLLHRTASATMHSRFLRHIEYSFLVMILFRLGRVVVTGLKSLLAFQYLGLDPSKTLSSHDAAIVWVMLTNITNNWHAISMMVSFLASFWLFLAWWLLRRYPAEGIPRALYSTAVGVLGGLVALVAGIATTTGADTLFLLDFFDIAASVTVITLVGWELRKLEPKRGHPALSTIVFLFFMSWAILQVPIPYFRDKAGDAFFLLLMFASFGSMLMTALYTSIVLKDRPEYEA